MKKQNGITLIALVISIIVMLVLAGVSINAIVGKNGVINKAQSAVLSSAIATIQEEIELYKIAKIADGCKGLDIYPIAENENNKVSMTSKFRTGDLQLSDLESTFKHYLIKKIGQKNPNIIPDVNNIELYNTFYYINEEAIPSVKSFSSTLVLYISDGKYEIISFEGLDWSGTGDISYALSVYDKTSASTELINHATYYTVGNNTYKLTGMGELKVCGELTSEIATLTPELTNRRNGETVNKIDFINICQKYSIQTTTTNTGTLDAIGKDSNGNTHYVKKLLIIAGDSQSCYILDMNNTLYAWGDSNYNKFLLGTTGLVEKPTILMQNVRDVWANYTNTIIVTFDEKIYISGANANGLLAQGDEEDYTSWVEPTAVTNWEEYISNPEITLDDLKYEKLIDNVGTAKLKNAYLNEASEMQMTIYYEFDNGEIYTSGFSSDETGIGKKYNDTKRCLNVTPYWNNRLAEIYPEELYTTKDIRKIQTVYSSTFIILNNNDILGAGWAASTSIGANTDGIINSQLNRCIDIDNNYLTGFISLGRRDCLITTEGIYYFRTSENNPDGSRKKWLNKSIKANNISEDINPLNSFAIGLDIISINGSIYNMNYDGIEMKYTAEKNEIFNNTNLLFNDSINNYQTMDSFCFYTTDGNFFAYNCDKIRLSEDNNLYSLYDTGFDGVIYTTTNGSNVDILLDSGEYIENLNKDRRSNISKENNFISKILATQHLKSVLYNDSNGNKNIFIKGNKYVGCWGLSPSNTREIILESESSSYPILELNDRENFEELKSDENTIFSNIKNMFTSDKAITSDFVNHVIGSFVVTNDAKLYWFGVASGGPGSKIVNVPGIQIDREKRNYYTVPGVMAMTYNRVNTSYPELITTETLDLIAEKISDIQFSTIGLTDGIQLWNTSILTEDGEVYVYGTSENANGTGTTQTDFTKLTFPNKIKKIFSAYGLSLAITENGDVYAWGCDYYRITGINNMYIPTPTKLAISNIYYISLGEGFAIYACSDGKVYGIGRNNFGQLGTGNNISATSFVESIELEK